jgi:hypothetical protein
VKAAIQEHEEATTDTKMSGIEIIERLRLESFNQDTEKKSFPIHT